MVADNSLSSWACIVLARLTASKSLDSLSQTGASCFRLTARLLVAVAAGAGVSVSVDMMLAAAGILMLKKTILVY